MKLVIVDFSVDSICMISADVSRMNGLLGLLDLDHFLVLVLGPRQRDVRGGGRVLHHRGWGREVFDSTHHHRRGRHQPILGRSVLDQVFVLHS